MPTEETQSSQDYVSGLPSTPRPVEETGSLENAWTSFWYAAEEAEPVIDMLGYALAFSLGGPLGMAFGRAAKPVSKYLSKRGGLLHDRLLSRGHSVSLHDVDDLLRVYGRRAMVPVVAGKAAFEYSFDPTYESLSERSAMTPEEEAEEIDELLLESAYPRYGIRNTGLVERFGDPLEEPVETGFPYVQPEVGREGVDPRAVSGLERRAGESRAQRFFAGPGELRDALQSMERRIQRKQQRSSQLSDAERLFVRDPESVGAILQDYGTFTSEEAGNRIRMGLGEERAPTDDVPEMVIRSPRRGFSRRRARDTGQPEG
jgi:hypothetical protein